MKLPLPKLLPALGVVLACNASAATRFVDLSSLSATPPYTSWATAATNIQQAIDAAVAGDQILVTNGIYRTGGRPVPGGTVTNRVAIDKAVTVQSMNGPAVTIIHGHQIPGTTNGVSAVRCVYLADDAALIGFTLTNGATGGSYDYGGGLWCDSTNAVVSNCVLTANCAVYQGGGAFRGALKHCTLNGNIAFDSGGAAYQSALLDCVISGNAAWFPNGGGGGGAFVCTLSNCTLSGNSTYGFGGGAYQSTLTACVLTGNSAYRGGGVEGCVLSGCSLSNNLADFGGGGAIYSQLNNCVLSGNAATGYEGGGAELCTLNNCTLTGNMAPLNGGGAHSCTLSNCTLSGNSSQSGGGADSCTLLRCILTANSATTGGGANASGLSGCVLTGNAADNNGGGAAGSTLTNCTLTGNSALAGGGADSSTLKNCIVYFNAAPNGANYSDGSAFDYCCTTPLPGSGSNNISTSPQLANTSHLSAGSPCRGAGDAGAAIGRDIDGQTWTSPPAIGCDEFISGANLGALTVAILASYTNSAPGYDLDFSANIGGNLSASRWEFGDGTIVSNLPYASHRWLAAGDYAVVMRAYNDSNPGGVSATSMVHILTNPVQYVAQANATPLAPFTSWATAATNINDALEAAFIGGTILVSNGVYHAGSRVVFGERNRVALTRPLALQSVNGPAATVIDGDGAMRCVYLRNGTSLAGFTLTNGTVAGDGGGLWCESTNVVVSNCVLTRNFVDSSSSGRGGGVFGGTLTNCTLSGNRSTTEGGGAYASVLIGCVLADNAATNYGGGASSCSLIACTLTNNSATYAGGGGYLSTLTNCALMSNQSYDAGGGAHSCTLDRCSLTGNFASGGGGGSAYSTLYNCAVSGNSTRYAGGGTQGGTNVNCSITGNSGFTVGGADGGSLSNCVVYFNRATRRDNYSVDATLDHCCATPIPFSGTGNLAVDPRLASASHLSADSPCRGAGSAGVVTGTDIDGQAWANPPAMGCDEFLAGTIGALTAVIQSVYTNVAAGFAVDFSAQISGAVTASRWDFGDGTVVSNQPYCSHRWATPGEYVVVLSAYNDSAPGGVSASFTIHVLTQPAHYVVLNNIGPVPPYNSWATAAANIQDAVDAAVIPGALVLVSNGTYQVGQRVIYGAAANRLAVTNPIVVQSVNGPALTVIRGASPVGVSAVRCVYLAAGATLAGFTLTNGASAQGGDWIREESGGGAWCEASSSTLSNCVLAGNSSNSEGGGVMGGSLFDCMLVTNSAYGGAASYSALSNCTLIGNLAYSAGGGASLCTLRACTLIGNSAPNWYGQGGGGAYSCVMEDCTVSSNSAYYAGGVVSSILKRCTLNANSSDTGGGGAGASQLYDSRLSENHAWSGGGADASSLDRCVVSFNSANYGAGAAGSTLRNCAIFGNAGKYAGGGTDGGTLNNCTLIGNSAATGGGASGANLTNCIIYYNTAATAANYSGGTLNYCCTTPLPAGVGNFATEPELADRSHISTASPCRAAGNFAYASGTDIDGEAWVNPPSMGCDELGSGAVTGNLSVAISAAFTNVVPGLELNFAGQIAGHVAASRWEFGDGSVLSNRPYASHSWTALGDYPLVLRAFNDSFPAGISATVTVHVVTQPVHYVAVSNGTPASPFTSWATAATNIQDAVDAVATAGALVLVSNGVYTGTVRWVNNDVPYRLVLDKAVTVQSVNGPEVTLIQGQPYPGAYGAIRCAYLAGGTALFGFTLTNGAAHPPWSETFDENRTGGGVWCDAPTALVSNCVIVACSAGEAGGGAYGGTLNDCTFLNNSAAQLGGGGAYGSSLNHCVLRNNTASWYGIGAGGGARSSTLNQCLLAENFADAGGGAGLSTLNNCTLTGNTAGAGGAADNCTLRNCALTANAASSLGGGANASTLYNCTVTGNAATNSGGGVAKCTNFNSLVYYNLAPGGSNWVNSSFDHGCTLPLPTSGPGNTAAEPQLADAIHLSAGSPGRGAGLAAHATGADIDGESWLNPPSIGCDELIAGGITGALSVAILAPYTNVASGFTLSLQMLLSGHASASIWDFGDGTVVSNRPFTSHSWAVPGDYTVALTSFNLDFPSGVSTSLTVHVQAPLHYVALENPAPVAPYSSWATAATTIQDAVDATFVGGTIIVSNGVYETGARVASGTLSNRVAVTRQMALQSVNGPAATVIQGNQTIGANAIRCVSLARDCTLIGFTLRNGGTRNDGDGDLDQTGGGVWCDSAAVVLSNCVITANTANGAAGVLRGTLYDCVISTNSPTGAAGSVLNRCSVLGNPGTGAVGCIMNNCLVQGNSAYDGGGVGGCLLTNCTITGNHAARYGGGSQASTMYNCIVTGNSARDGGGIYNDWMYNCTIVGNSANGYGGGALIASLLYNCIIYDNGAANGPNYWSDNLAYCCTTPFYAGGPGNITNAPLFMNEAAGNLRLQPNSPCINSGYNAYAPAGFDFDGNPRVVGGTVDIGAFEFQASASDAFAAWLQQYGLPADGSADYADPDGDRMNNWQEWIAGTIPTNGLSRLRLLNPTRNPSGITLTWESVSSRTYFLERSSNLGAQPAFLTLATNLAGQSGTTSFTDTNAGGPGPFFYRVGVQTGSNQFQTAISVISFAWLQQYGLPTDGSADYADPDGDRMNNWQEWRADTNPTNALSVLRMVNATNSPDGAQVTWQSVATRVYWLERATNLGVASPFQTVATNLAGAVGTQSFTDTSATNGGPYFYRVGVP